MTYPVAEIFHSVQGEGVWTGTPMMFVRLAGCCVGEYAALNDTTYTIPQIADLKLLEEKKHSICTTFDGQRFLCDTDYHSTMKLTAEKILAQLQGEEHICITGGEPLMHNLAPLLMTIWDSIWSRPQHRMLTHIETSGTLPWPMLPGDYWFTVSPKRKCKSDWFNYADEFKLLIGPNYDDEALETLLAQVKYKTPVYLQPINGVNEVSEDNMQVVLDLLKKFPRCRLSAQLHKYLKVR